MKLQNKTAITRREFVAGTIAGSLFSPTIAHSQVKSAMRPNIVFILADDLGWGDLSCYGRPEYKTPNLDRLAREGIRFTNAYSAAPLCTPTRCAFHTGRYPARTSVGLEEPLHERKSLGDRIKTAGIPPEHPTIASLLKAAGYQTALIGKWHLGYLPEFGPNRHGFDEFFGIHSGAINFFTHEDMMGTRDLYENEVPVERVGYITDLLTERAVDFLSRPQNSPFYLSLHYTSPHWPWQSPADGRTEVKLGPAGFRAGGSLKAFASMMKSLDDSVGKVLKALNSSGLDRNTLVIFTSDNGGERFSYNWPFSGQKGVLREGGIRVPAIVRWPKKVPAGSTTDQAVITMDWTSTILAAAGAKPDAKYPMDGVDLLPSMNGAQPKFDRKLFWRTRRQKAVRSGNWKYFHDGDSEFLFDLSVDEREQADFKESNPDMLKNLKNAFNEWQSGVLEYPKV